MNNKTSYKYPFTGKGRLKTKQSGMTLIEVLVAMFVLALGVLALLAVQLRAVSGVREAESQTIVLPNCPKSNRRHGHQSDLVIGLCYRLDQKILH